MRPMLAFDKRWLYRLIGLAIFFGILSTVDLSRLKLVIEESEHLWLILVALPITYGVIFIRYYRWYRICGQQEIAYPFWEGFIIYIASFGLGIITPGRLGELMKVNYLKNRGNFFGRSFFCIVLDRISDIGAMLLVAVPGALLMIPHLRANTGKHTLFIASGTVALCLVFFFIYKWRRFRKRSLKTIDKPTDGGIAMRILGTLKQYPAYFGSIGLGGMVEIVLLTFVSWAFIAVQHYLFATALCLSFTLFQIWVFASVAGLVTLLPISISGLGTREMTLIYLFSICHVSKEKAILFSGCMLLTILFYGVGSFLAWEMPGIKNMLVSLRKAST
jgi:uncharacterized protein (TIRG00374 family)